MILSTGTAGRDPLLARWRHGAGWVATLPLALGSTDAAALQDAPDFRKAVSAVVGDLVHGRPADPLAVRADVAAAGVRLTVMLADPPADFVGENVRVTVLPAAGGAAVREMVLTPAGGGAWTSLVAGLAPGTYRVNAAGETTAGLTGTAVFAVNAPADVPANGPAVASLGRHEFASYVTDGRFVESVYDLRPVVTLAAIAGLVGMVAVRRWPAGRA